MKETVVATIDEIHQKLLRSQELARFTAQENEDPENVLLRRIHERFGDSRLVRSDNLIEKPQALRLYIKAENVRNKLFAKGKDITNHPEYDSQIANTQRDEEQAKRFFFIENEDFDVYADLDPLEENTGDKLLLKTKDDTTIEFSLSFLDAYWINITFGHEREKGYGSYFFTGILNDMTQEEYAIMSHYITQADDKLSSL